MTAEQFDNYSFSNNTEVEINGKWIKVFSVDFESREIAIGYCMNINLDLIKDIRN